MDGDVTPEAVESLRLSPEMRRHLLEMAALGDGAGWGPQTAGEWQVARALERRGLLKTNVTRGWMPYGITALGMRVAGALAATEGGGS